MASKGPTKSFWETAPGIITAIGGTITALATLVAALVSAGIIKSPTPTPQPTLFPTNIPTSPVSEITETRFPTSETITITVTNNNCSDEDYYVDGVNILTISAESTSEFQTTAGEHVVYVCRPGTLDCGSSVTKNWLGSTTASINRADHCDISTPAGGLITITLTNNNCDAEDYYVDGVNVITISAESTAQFQTTAGQHEVYVCFPDTQNCGSSVTKNWLGSTEAAINRGDYCDNRVPAGDPITITLTNNNCDAEDYYVDGMKVVTISAESTANFQTTAGQHEVYVCVPETQNCGTTVTTNWSGSTEAAINRGDYCP